MTKGELEAGAIVWESVASLIRSGTPSGGVLFLAETNAAELRRLASHAGRRCGECEQPCDEDGYCDPCANRAVALDGMRLEEFGIGFRVRKA